jgi:predicted kinase
VPFTGLWLDVDPEVAAARVGARSGDASDADAAVVRFQEGLDPGQIDWHRLDANRDLPTTLAEARGLVGG